MIKETIDDLKDSLGKAHDALKRELTKLRTGRAHPSLLESLRVDAYGSPTPIQQLATVGVPEARLLTIKPWDKSNLKAIEKAIVSSPLGLTPQNDGEIIRVPLPALSEERRKELVKLARRAGEDAKVTIRKIRHDAKDLIDTIVDDKDASEDEGARALKTIEDLVQQATTEVDRIIERKEKDILEV